MAKFEEGQEVIATGHGGPITLQVHKVGRVYVHASRYVDSRQWRKFRLTDGYEDNARGGGGRLYTLAEWDDVSARNEAIAELERLGLITSGWRAGSVSTDQLRRIANILKEE